MPARRLAALLAAIAPACGDEPAGAPDLEALVEAYERPTMSLTEELANVVVAESLPALAGARASDGFSFLSGSIESARRTFVERGVAFEEDIDGGVRIRVICPGVSAEPELAPDAQRDGTIELRMPIENAKLGPVGFGAAAHCGSGRLSTGSLPAWLRIASDGASAVLDGPVQVHLGTALWIGDDSPLKPIFVVRGSLAVEGLPVLSDFDVRIPAPGVIEARIENELGETAIVGLQADELSLRDRSGVWTCEVDEAGEARCAIER